MRLCSIGFIPRLSFGRSLSLPGILHCLPLLSRWIEQPTPIFILTSSFSTSTVFSICPLLNRGSPVSLMSSAIHLGDGGHSYLIRITPWFYKPSTANASSLPWTHFPLSVYLTRSYLVTDWMHPSPSAWFTNQSLALTELSLFCVPLLLNGGVAFNRLSRLELSEFPSDAPLHDNFIPALFSIASGLRHIRLGVIASFRLSPSKPIRSLSLQSLDIDFDSGSFAGDLLYAMDIPNLTDLTVRSVHMFVYRLLGCPDLLSQIVAFAVQGDIGDYQSLQHLFSAMPRLRVLDLAHSNRSVSMRTANGFITGFCPSSITFSMT